MNYLNQEQRWHPMSEDPELEYGWFIVYAESADPEKPFRHMAFWSKDEGWSGLVEYWLKHLTHWHPLPNPPTK